MDEQSKKSEFTDDSPGALPGAELHAERLDAKVQAERREALALSKEEQQIKDFVQSCQDNDTLTIQLDKDPIDVVVDANIPVKDVQF